MTRRFVRGTAPLAEAVRTYGRGLTDRVAGRRVVVWGAGRGGTLAVGLLRRAGVLVTLVVDRAASGGGSYLDGVPVAGLDALRTPDEDFVVLASMHAADMGLWLQARGWRRDHDFTSSPAGSIYRPEVGCLLHQLPPPEPGSGPAAPPADDGPPVTTVLASSAGNFYFRELQRFLVDGLARRGWQVRAADERAARIDGVPIVVGPHEFFSVGDGPDWLTADNLRAAVLVSTEQPRSFWTQAFARATALAGAVVDLSPAGVRAWASAGVGAEWLPLGWSPGCGAFDDLSATSAMAIAPEVGVVAGVLPEVRDDAWNARPIDVLFVGAASPRRERWLARLQRQLPEARWLVHLPTDATPIGGGVDTAQMVALARRSKVILNLHRDDTHYFEWQRIVWRGLWQRALVVTETCEAVPGLVAGRDYLEAPVDGLAGTLRDVLSPAGVARADAVRVAGWRSARAITFARTEAVLAAAVARVRHAAMADVEAG